MRTLLALSAALLLLTVGPGATASTSTPPRNGLIAVNGPEGIYIVDPSAGTTTLVPDTAEMGDPAWSSDATRLAVSAGSNVLTMKPDGSDRRLVLENAYTPAWSPDGRQLVVVREGTPSGDVDGNSLTIVNADGSDARTIDLGQAADSFFAAPEWSPDGRLIAFVLAGGQIGLVTPEGKRVPMPVETTVATGVAWSPDSTKLAYDRDSGSKDPATWNTAVLDLATGKQSFISAANGSAESPTWSPEGDQLAFVSTSAESATTTQSRGSQPAAHLWVAAPDGTKAHQIVQGELYGTPSWARAAEAAPAPVADEQPALPAEQEPAPAADNPAPISEPPSAETSRPVPAPPVAKGLIAVRGSNAIYLVDPVSAAVHKVPDTADMIAPAWSPDGSLLAVERVGTDGSSSVYTIRPDGTHAQLVAKDASAPWWSPAGDQIFVVRNECSTPCEPEDDEANVLYSVRPDGSGLQRVDLQQSDLTDPRELAWRADGSPISFFDDGSENGPGTFDTTAAAWSPDESQIAFVGALGPTGDEDSADRINAGLWIVSADGGTPQLLLGGASGWPSWPS